MANDYSAWPVTANVQARLSSAGLSLRSGADIQGAIDAVTDEVTRKTLRTFVADSADETRTYDGTGTAELEIDEIVSLTSVAIVGIQTAPGYTLTGVTMVREQNKPVTRLVVARGSVPAYVSEGIVVPYPSLFPAGRQNIQVTGKFGYGATVPKDLWHAVCGEIAHRLAAEAIFDPAGRLRMRKEGDEEQAWSLSDADATKWHPTYLDAIGNYKRPAGRRLRNMRPRMI